MAVVFLPVVILAAVPFCLWIATAKSASGRVAGWTAFSVVTALVALVVVSRLPSRDWRHLLLVAVPLMSAMGLVALLIRWAPSRWERRAEGPGLHSVFLDEAPRRGFLDLVPEVDRVTLGAALLTRLDPWMRADHARRTRRVLADFYEEMAQDPSTHDLATTANEPFLELAGIPFDSKHYDVYVPKYEKSERLGLLVFLHGNAGNLQVVSWAWKTFADRERYVVVSPSYGFGFWGGGCERAVQKVVEHVMSYLPIDKARVVLGGVSDGGNGVTRVGGARPDLFAALIYVSPTLVVHEVTASEFLAGWKGRPVLVLQGDEDHNVVKKDVDRAVRAMSARGVAITYQVFPGEDHFLLFGRRRDVCERVAEWQARFASLGPTPPSR